MLTKADDYPVHQTPDPIAFAGTDRNFYDRYFFNGYTTDGGIFFGAALGVYPQLGIMDAAFAVRVDGVQHNLRASRHMHLERMDTKVGPIGVTVEEPLQRLRVVVDDNEHGIFADLTIEGRHSPIEEPRTTKRNGSRVVQDVTRMTQLGRWSGTIRVGDREVSLKPDSAVGTRDRSWGIRPVGIRDPQAPVTPQEFQVWWYWIPAHFDDRVVHFYINEDGFGNIWNAAFIVQHDNGEREHLRDARAEIEFSPGSRYPRRAAIVALNGSGQQVRLTAEAGARFFLSGIGYMHPDWSHGLNKGPLALAYDSFPTASVTKHEAPYQHVQAFADATLELPGSQVLTGHAAFESIVLGRHDPSGLTSMFDVP